MASRITELVIDCTDPQRLANFWCEVLGYVELGWEGDDLEIGPPGTGFGSPQPTNVFNRDQAPRPGKLRLHIDINPTDINPTDINPTDRDQEAELTRLLAIGARPVDIGQTGLRSWHVLADPEANEFCLLRKRIAEV